MSVWFVFALCAAAAGSVRGEAVPLLAWGGAVESSPFSALEIASADDLSAFVRGSLRPSTYAVAFVEPTLSVEDFSLRPDGGDSSFSGIRALMRDERSAFVRAADAPNAAIEAIVGPNGADRARVTEDGVETDAAPSKTRFLIVSLGDAKPDEPRERMLARHDELVRETYERLKRKHRDVVAFYTGEGPFWIEPERRAGRVGRHLLAAEPDPSSNFYNASDAVYVFAQEIALKTNGETKNLTDGTISAEYASENEVVATLTFDDTKLQLAYSRRLGYWTLDYVRIQDTNLTTKDEVGAPMGFSYHCGQKTMWTSQNSTDTVLSFVRFQTQPFFNTTTNGQFSSAYDCVSVMSIPIWSGLFLVSILLLILSCGITMIMDIRTMDRFDDPKGKTITINASE